MSNTVERQRNSCKLYVVREVITSFTQCLAKPSTKKFKYLELRVNCHLSRPLKRKVSLRIEDLYIERETQLIILSTSI